MPLKVNVGLSKKIGQPDYGSFGASCHVETELDSSLLRDDLEGFHRQVKQAFVACRQAVFDQLANGQSKPSAVPDRQPRLAGVENGNQPPITRSRLSDKQLSYLQQLAKSIPGVTPARLDQLSHQMFGKPLVQITALDASTLIDTLKAAKKGQLSLDGSFSGAAA